MVKLSFYFKIKYKKMHWHLADILIQSTGIYNGLLSIATKEEQKQFIKQSTIILIYN